MSKAAERLQAFDKWLDQNPLIRKVISNLGGIAGGAFWIKMAVAQGGAQVIATVLAVDYA